MKSNTNGIGASQATRKMNVLQGEGPNWVFVVGGALLSTLSIKLGCQLKRAFDNKRHDEANKENRKSTADRRSRACNLHNLYHFAQDEDNHYHFLSETSRVGMDAKRPKSPIAMEADLSLPLVKIPAAETNKVVESIMRASLPDRLELPWKPFHHSNCSDSCISESGSDIYSKREVIQKLRQQLKQRDEMIMEMQAQITDMQNSLHIQRAQTAHLQSQLDSADKDLFNSEREVRRLRKVIADHHVTSPDKLIVAGNWHPESANGLANGYADSVNDLELRHSGGDKGEIDGEKVEMLKTEVSELKGVIEGKDFLLQSYKDQKVEFCSKIKELQLKLASQVPNIL
ncbi:hypothetical protein MUK42_08854 [Musa troglodytarum]|uniref:Uncharacterized protein n=1 Tax=Musa troglodytarum TaxID=320322 RepID=A0A9E7EBH4_9LILI|nr:hypothetical protein MUK42_08854 [Musa troglodytarum]URD73880.1 hypothetical protein MUK42_08854 [Musa troglodytarum]